MFFSLIFLRTLAKYINEKQDDWDVFLSDVVESINSKEQTSTKMSPHKMMYGVEAKLDIELKLFPQVSFGEYFEKCGFQMD